MKAAQMIKYGGTEAIAVKEDVPRPVLGEGKVLVEVYAASVNPFDWKLRAGYMKDNIPLDFPVTLGGDFSGVIVDAGSGVSNFKENDEVYGQASFLSGGSGSLAQFDLADPKTIALKPKNVDHVQAAALPLTGVSAVQGITEHINLQPGQKILIHGGAGGIGTAAIQLAKHIGAYVATTVSADDFDYVKSLGADEVIDYKNQKFEDLLSDFDAVFDTVGGDTYTRSFKVLRKGGIVVSMLEQPNQELMEQYGVKAIAQGTKVNTECLTKLAALVDEGVLKEHIDKVFPLDQAGEALTYLKEGHPEGKVVVKIK